MKSRKFKKKNRKKYLQLEELKTLDDNLRGSKDSIRIKKKKIKLYLNEEDFLKKHKTLLRFILYIILLFLVLFFTNFFRRRRTRIYKTKSPTPPDDNIIKITSSEQISVKRRNIKDFNFIKNRTRESRDEALIKGKTYMTKCLNGLLFNHNENEFIINDNPKISVIIPIYNSEKIINSTIKSVQNQNMLDIEIILVNDFSTDNSLLLIQKLKETDPRIKIINNEKNMGILYSRCIAVLQAKGKYILNLDHDDFFFDERLFDELYEEAEEGNFDIVSFMDLEINDYNVDIPNMNDGPCTHHPDNLIILQPELPYYPMFEDDHFDYIDIQIWGKIFKASTYKNAVNLLGKERYSTYNAINEDIVGTFSICIVAESYKYMRRYGLFHLVGGPTAVRRASLEHTIQMTIFLSDIIFDFSKNENKKYAAIMLDTISHLYPQNKKSFKNLFDKIMNCTFIKDEYKTKLKEKFPGAESYTNIV